MCGVFLAWGGSSLEWPHLASWTTTFLGGSENRAPPWGYPLVPQSSPSLDWDFPIQSNHLGVPPWRAGNPHLIPDCTILVFPVGLPSQNIFEIRFLDYFCNYHDGRGLGKKWCLFDHLGYRKRITRGMGAMHFILRFLKVKQKKTWGGGILRHRKKNWTYYWLFFATW